MLFDSFYSLRQLFESRFGPTPRYYDSMLYYDSITLFVNMIILPLCSNYDNAGGDGVTFQQKDHILLTIILKLLCTVGNYNFEVSP